MGVRRTVDEATREEIARIVGEGNAIDELGLADRTTFRIGGPAELFAMPRSIDEAARLWGLCRSRGVDVRVLGEGSDLLVADEGVRGVVMSLSEHVDGVELREGGLFAEAGATNAEVSRAACEAGLSGYEFACGIPGSIGGAAIMNAGAYGGQFSDVAESVLCADDGGRVFSIPAEEAGWGYRKSVMDDEGYLVLGAVLALAPDDRGAIQGRIDDLTARRESKQPLSLPSAGSTFKRPEGHFAGKLIEDAGLRGCRRGGAQVSEVHAGFVVNAGGATASDVAQLVAHVRAVVRERSGVELEPEVRPWGLSLGEAGR